MLNINQMLPNKNLWVYILVHGRGRNRHSRRTTEQVVCCHGGRGKEPGFVQLLRKSCPVFLAASSRVGSQGYTCIINPKACLMMVRVVITLNSTVSVQLFCVMKCWSVKSFWKGQVTVARTRRKTTQIRLENLNKFYTIRCCMKKRKRPIKNEKSPIFVGRAR